MTWNPNPFDPPEDPVRADYGFRIPSPEEVRRARDARLFAIADSLKQRIIAALRNGLSGVEFSGEEAPHSERLIEILKPDFEARGWRLLNHGLSLTVQPRSTE